MKGSKLPLSLFVYDVACSSALWFGLCCFGIVGQHEGLIATVKGVDPLLSTSPRKLNVCQFGSTGPQQPETQISCWLLNPDKAGGTCKAQHIKILNENMFKYNILKSLWIFLDRAPPQAVLCWPRIRTSHDLCELVMSLVIKVHVTTRMYWCHRLNILIFLLDS